MVKGIEKFKEHFGKYQDNYVIIGGTACEVHEDAAGQKPRATKDIDMILIVEALWGVPMPCRASMRPPSRGRAGAG